MKKKGINPMIIGAVVCAGLAIYAVWYMMEQNRIEHEQSMRDMQSQFDQKLKDAKGSSTPVQVNMDTNTRNVILAREQIGANNRIDQILLEQKQIPEDLFPNAYEDFAEVEGLVARRDIAPGEPLTTDNIVKGFQKMADRLTPGMRAIALPVISRGDATGGFATDGDRVDLIAVANLVGYKDEQITKTILQNVRILYMPPAEQHRTTQTQGVSPNTSPEIPVTTTFEVTPIQAEAMIQLSQSYKIYMVLRHKDDHVLVRSQGVNTLDIADNPDSVQRKVDRSYERLDEVQAEIEAKRAATSTPSDNNPASPSNETILQP